MKAFFSHHQAWGNTHVPSITFECFWGPAAGWRVWVAWLTGSWADFLLVHSEKVISPLHSGGTLLFLWIWSSAFHVARFSLSWEKSKVSSDQLPYSLCSFRRPLHLHLAFGSSGGEIESDIGCRVSLPWSFLEFLSMLLFLEEQNHSNLSA